MTKQEGPLSFFGFGWRMFSPETKHISHTVTLKILLMFRCFQEAGRIIIILSFSTEQFWRNMFSTLRNVYLYSTISKMLV